MFASPNGNMEKKESMFLPTFKDNDFIRWFDIENLNSTITNRIVPNTMNQTSNLDDPFPLPEGHEWYPFGPGGCPKPYYVILQGVCAPLIIIISTVLNSLIAVVLLQKQLRSPTNILLLAIALYDTLTGLFPFPTYIYVFTFRNCDDFMPFNYGWFHRINSEVLPFIFHTCSIWVTVVLAIQRYIYVCHSEKAKRWCTISMALKAIACVNILAFIVAIPMFLEGSFYQKTVKSMKDPTRTFEACVAEDNSRGPMASKLYSVYAVLRGLLINIGPCTLLVILNAILVERMKEAKQNRERLIKKRAYEPRGQEQTNVTQMLIIVVTIFLIVEVPMALFLIIYGILKLLEVKKFGEALEISAQLLNFSILLSYPINFFIYCRMSRAFRDAFTQLLCPSINQSRQDSLPLPTTQFIQKPHNNNNNHEINDANIVMNNSNIEILPSSTVILNATTAETPRHTNSDEKKNSIVTLGKQRVLFRDDVNISTNTRFTDL